MALAVPAVFTVITTLSLLTAHGESVMDQRSVYVPAAPKFGVNVDVAEAELLNCEPNTEGPETTDHPPVPVGGVFAARFALPLEQIV